MALVSIGDNSVFMRTAPLVSGTCGAELRRPPLPGRRRGVRRHDAIAGPPVRKTGVAQVSSGPVGSASSVLWGTDRTLFQSSQNLSKTAGLAMWRFWPLLTR